jgi:hypothetical protein
VPLASRPEEERLFSRNQTSFQIGNVTTLVLLFALTRPGIANEQYGVRRAISVSILAS